MQEVQSFTADVKIAGINPYVDVPGQVLSALGGGMKLAVLVRGAGVDPAETKDIVHQKNSKLEKDAARLEAIGRLTPEGWFRSTLVPLRSHPTRLYLDTWMRDTAGVGVGDRVRVTLKPDLASRDLSMPAVLHEAMSSNEEAKVAWEALTPSRQREILSYLNFLKTPAALERNVQKLIANLLAEEDHHP